ncbi:MAG: hypothetical protein LBV12_05160, partial [Puniceicoccales bacterium]|nr:hypothetical protein [Puniceicoccales bacterium]
MPGDITSHSSQTPPDPREQALHIDLLTLFPRMIEGFLSESILGRAQENNLLSIAIRNIRDWATDKNKRVDDTPFGGGAGMVMAPQPLFVAIENFRTNDSQVIYLCPDGEPLTNEIARGLSTEKHLILISGHYEGIDQR